MRAGSILIAAYFNFDLRATDLEPKKRRNSELQMTHTRYSRPNIVLLIAGGLVCLFIVFLTSMTAGFATEPIHDFKSVAAVCLLCLCMSAVPFYLVMFRWSGVGSIGMWCITLSYFLLALVAGILPHLMGLLVLLAIEALICESIKAGSRNTRQT
jgi:hypothetical protein